MSNEKAIRKLKRVCLVMYAIGVVTGIFATLMAVKL